MALAILVTRHVPKAELPALYLSVGYYGWRMNGLAQACRRLGIDPACSTLKTCETVCGHNIFRL